MNDKLTIPGVFADIANAIREKNGETNKILPENMPDKIRAITTGATIKTTDGWEGTPVPSSGIAGNVYFNKDMPTEQVAAIFDSIEMFNTGEGVYITAFIYNNAQVDDNDYTNGIMLYKFDVGTGASYQMVGVIDNYESPIFQSGPYFADSFQGWNPDYTSYEVPVGYENQLTTLSVALGVKIENERVSSVLSSTPFIFTPGETITLEGEYDGDTVVNNDHAVISRPTAVPNSGHVGTVYFNNKLSIEETREIFSQLEFVKGSDGDWYYTMLASESKTGVSIITGNDANYQPSKTGYWVVYSKNGTLSAIPFHQFDTFAEQLGYIGWNPNSNSLSFDDVAISESIDDATGELVQIGHMNDLLANVFSTTPFEGTDEDANETFELDMKQYIENKKIPLKIKMNVKKSGALVKSSSGWSGTPIPDSGNVEKLYFNTEYAPEDVLTFMFDMMAELDPTFDPTDPETEITFPICICQIQNKTVGLVLAYEDNSFMIVGMDMSNGSLVEIVFVYSLNSETNSSLYDYLGFIGWNPALNGVIELNTDILDITLLIGADGYPLWREVVNRLSCLISITPITKGNGQEIKLEGIYDGNTLEVKELPKDGWNAATVPNSGHVNKVYFNTDMPNAEVIELLKTLTYVDLGLGGLMCPLIANTAMDKIFFAMTDGGWGYHIAYSTSLSPDDMIIIFNAFGTEPDPEPGWPTCWNPDINYNEIGNIDSDVLGDFMGFTIGAENDKISSIFSIEPPSEANTINLVPYVEDKKIPLKIKIANEAIDTTLVTGWYGTEVYGDGMYDSTDIRFNNHLSIKEADQLMKQLTYGDYLGTGEQIYIYICLYYYSSPDEKIFSYINKLDDGYVITAGHYANDRWIMYNSSPSSEASVGFLGWNPDREPYFGIDYKEATTKFDFPVAQENDKITGLISVGNTDQCFKKETAVLEGEYRGITIDVTENTVLDIRSLIETYKEIPLYININVKTNDEPEDTIDWEYPVQNGDELTITQAYSLTQQDNTLEVE